MQNNNIFPPLVEIQCPCCTEISQLKVRNTDPHFTRCLSCKTYLVVHPWIQSRPGVVRIALEIFPVSITVDEKTGRPSMLPHVNKKALERAA